MLSVNYFSVGESLDGKLDDMQFRLSTALNLFQTGSTAKIPIVGDELGYAANIVSSFREELQEGLQDLGIDANPTDLQIQTALSSHLNAFLAGAGLGGVHVSHAGGATTIQMVLQGSVDLGNVAIDFATGLPSLPVQVLANGQIVMSVGYALNLSFSIDVGGNVTLNNGNSLSGVSAPDADHPIVDPNSSLAIFVSASLSSNFNAKAIFGFVEGNAAPIAGMRNGLYATALVNNLTGTPTIKLDGSADANLRLTGSFAGTNNDFPGISTDFHLHWGLSSSAPSSGAPTVSFDNVSLSFGTFLSNVLKPALQPIKNALDPISPVVQLLGTEVPGMSDLSKAAGLGPLTFVDLAALGSQATGFGPLGELAAKVEKVLAKIDSLQLGTNITMPLGGFDLDSPANGDLRSAAISGDFTNLDVASLSQFAAAHLNSAAQSAAQSYHDLVAGLNVDQSVKNELNGLVDLPTANGFQIAFPILDNPANAVFNMILGKDSDLFYLKADAVLDLQGPLGLSYAAAPGVDVPISYSGQAHIDTHFRFAYDTFGLRQLIRNLVAGDASHILSDITDGFYINDDSYFKLAGYLKAETNFVGATVVGEVSTQNHGADPIHVYIEDPNGDGKLRFSEFQVGQDGQKKGFLTTGELDAELHIKVDLPETDDDHDPTFNVAHTALITFTIPTPLRLASAPDANGNVTLYLGTNAGLRIDGGGQDAGDETFTIRHVGVSAGGENITVSAFGLIQAIDNVRNIVATDLVGVLTIIVMPGVTSDAHFVGGQGRAVLDYRGTGAAYLTGGAQTSTLSGGAGTNVLTGGAGDDTIYLGTGINTVDGAGGHNTVIVKAPIVQNGTINGGSGSNNSLQILGSQNTVAISAVPVAGAFELRIQNSLTLPTVFLQMSHFGDVFVNARDSATSYTFGDLGSVGVHDLTLDLTTQFKKTRVVDLDTRAGNAPSAIAIQAYTNQYEDPQHPGTMISQPGAIIANSTTGLTTKLLGFRGEDTLTLRHHGGSIAVDPLGFTSGHFVFDTANRTAGQAESINIITPAKAGGINLAMTNDRGDVLITTTNYSSFRIQGDRTGDNLNLDVTAATSGANTLTLDASSVHGVFTVHILGTAAAIDHVTLSKVGTQADVSILGQSTTTDLMFGTGKLSLIRHNVSASNVQLSVDNDEARMGSILTLTATTFGNWIVPELIGLTPQLNFSGLRSQMEIFAGAGDRFDLEVTPPSITGLTMHNASMTVQDLVYVATWAVPLALLGNFSFFAGQRIYSNGTVERLKRLLNIHSNVTLDYQGNGPSQMVLDGDLDAPGAQYVVNAVRPVAPPVPVDRPNFIVNNQTVGLNVKIYGYQQVDTIYVYMPGATVGSDLREKLPATIYFDGRNRLAGTNPTSPNNINMLVAAGEITMTPENTYDSKLKVFNTVYVLGAMPQDSLNVTAPTEFKMASTAIGQSQIRFDYALGGQAGFTVTSPTARYTVHSTVAQLPINPLNPNPSEVVQQPINPITSFVDRAIMYQDLTNSPLEAQKIAIRGNTIPWTFNVGGVFVTIPVEVIVNLQIYQPNPNPIATDNHVNIDASQLRGTFGFQVSEPDYAYAELLADGLLRGAAPPATNFSQSYVTISKTNPQLTTTITGTTQTNASHYDRLVRFASGGTVSRWAGMQVTAGTGDLGTLQGNLTVNQAWLKEVDNRNAALANIIQLTTTGVSWDAGDGGRTSLTLSNLQGKLTVTGNPLDRFAVEGTPNTAYRTILHNFSTAATPSGVYVMGKNVMPLEVSGNFDLAVGRRLNLDGTVTNVGTILGAFDDAKNYVYTGGMDFLFGSFPGVWQDFELRPVTSAITGPITWDTSGYLTSYVGGAQPKPPLPIYYDYSGPGQGTFVFDASNETVTDRVLGDMIVQYGGASLNGISSNSNYAGKADMRFYESEVIYGPNTNVSWYGTKIRTNTNAFDVMAPTLLNNLLNGTVRYFANTANVGQTPIEQILIGATLGPVYVEGSGRNTRVEINPLFSLPTSLAMGIFDTSINNQSVAIGSHPGWGAAHTGGYSLIDTIQANVSVSSAALRVIADIPRPVGSPPITSRPNVTIDGSSMTGIGTGTINYSNLVDSVNVSQFTFNSQLDLNPLRFPGLNIQLPAHFPVNATVQNTPSGATTQISTVLSSANNTFTNAALNVLGTTGKLILGDMYGVAPTNGDKFNWPGLAGNISTSWSDGISVSQINIGNNGSLAGIQGAILLKGDSHSTTTTVTNIDGRTDAARSNVVFTRPDYSSNPFPTQLVPYQQVDGLASVPIYFGQFYMQTHPLNIYGSPGSSYNVVSGPVNMKLYAGTGSSTTVRGTPLTVTGGSTVTTLMPYGLQLPNFTGVPEFYVEQDPANPAPINIVVERFDQISNSNFRLESAGGGMMRLVDRFILSPFNDFWRLNYKGSDATISINHGIITVADTGSLGTTVSSKANQVNVLGTTNLLKILPVGTQTGNAIISLGNNNNMQAILGNVEITPNASGPGSANNQNDTAHRDIHVSHVANVLTVTGMAPGTIKYFSQFAPFLYGGSGGSTFYLDNMPSYASYLNIKGGSSVNDIGVAPDVGATFDIAVNNYTFVNSKVVFDGVESLRGGAGNDTFRFTSSGSLTGGIDGGAGIDTLSYESSSLWHSPPYDLSIGKIPLAAGTSTSIERAPFDVLSPGTKTNPVGAPITPITMSKYGGPLSVTWSATNLPTGLSIDAQTGVISGTIAVQASGNRTVQVNATDGTYSSGTSFTWTLQGPSITNPGTQTTFINSSVSLALSTQGGGTLTYSASNLPTGLSINQSTGLISGTVAAQVAGPRQVTVSVSNGFNTSPTTFSWDIPAHSLTIPSNQSTAVGNAVTPLTIVATNVHAPLTFLAVGLPNGVTINDTTGVISGTVINQSGAVGAHAVTVYANDGFNNKTAAFTWTVTGFGLTDPGTIVSAGGATISRQIGSVGEPANTIYSVTGLPLGLAMDQHGLIAGTIDPANALTGLFPVHVSATNGTVSADVNFDWRVIGFAVDNVADQFVPEGLPIALQFPVTNLQHENLTFTVSGLPGNFSVDSQGVLRGTFNNNAPTVGNVIYNATVTASNGFATDTATVKITTYDGYTLYGFSDKGSYAGSDVNEYMQVYSPYNHNFTVTFTGLPAGLTFDGNYYVQGTISESAVSATPHHVTVQVINNTLDASKPTEPAHTYSFSFDWTVRHLPTAAELNAGTPSGVPQLVNIVDPSNSYPETFYGITAGSGASEHAVVYFRSAGKIWQVSNGLVSAVQSIDPDYSNVPNADQIVALSRNGLLLTGEGTDIWLVDEAGGRSLNLGSGSFSSSAVTIGDTYYLSVYHYDQATGEYGDEILSIHFEANGQVTAGFVPNSFGLRIKVAFAGGLLATTDNVDRTQSLRWFNPTTGQIKLIAVSQQYGYFDQVLVTSGTGGTATAFINEYLPSFGYRIAAISSTAMQSANPTLVLFPLLDSMQRSPVLVGDKLVYGFSEFDGSATVIKFSITDGSLAGTTTYTTPLVSNSADNSVSYMTAVGTDMYFVFTPNFNSEGVSDDTLVRQIWKLDTVTGALTNVADYRGLLYVYAPPTELTAGDGRLYFVSANEEITGLGLWSYDLTNGLTAIDSYEDNPYNYPGSLTFIDGSLYFRATADKVLDLTYNQPSYQAWVILPAEVTQTLPGDFNLDGTVDAADYVMWRVRGMSAADYNIWRQNFGRSITAGQPELPGDFDHNGVVDTADYVMWRTRGMSAADYNTWRQNFGRSITISQPELPGDFDHSGVVDAADYIKWRMLGMSAAEYNTWRQHFGQTSQTGGGAVATSSSISEAPVAHAASGAEAPRHEALPASSLSGNDSLLVEATPSNRKSRSFAIDFDLKSLLANDRVGTTSGARSRTAVPIGSDATRRDELLALCQANRLTDAGTTVPTAFDVDWHIDTANSDDVNDFDIHAIDDAFEEL